MNATNVPNDLVQFRRSKRQGIAGAVILALIGVPLLVGGLRDAARERRIAHGGATIEATALQAITRTKNGDTHYGVQYSFTPPGGHDAITGTSDVSLADFWHARSAGRLTVVYLPDDPATNRAQSSPAPVGGAYAAVGLGTAVLVLFGALAVVGALKKPPLSPRAS